MTAPKKAAVHSYSWKAAGLLLAVALPLQVDGDTDVPYLIQAGLWAAFAVSFALWVFSTSGLVTVSEGHLQIRVPYRRRRRVTKRQVRAETESLIKDLQTYIREAPSTWLESQDRAQAYMDQIRQDMSDAERHAIWQELSRDETERHQRDHNEVGFRFGGRLEWLMAEYAKRGILERGDRMDLYWASGSSSVLPHLVARLEVLAKRL